MHRSRPCQCQAPCLSSINGFNGRFYPSLGSIEQSRREERAFICGFKSRILPWPPRITLAVDERQQLEALRREKKTRLWSLARLEEKQDGMEEKKATRTQEPEAQNEKKAQV